jgi:dTDP-4-dehydrorhamnose 3,5-epimerase-like enzyme
MRARFAGVELGWRRVSIFVNFPRMNVQVQRIELKADGRGCVWEPLTAAELSGQKNAHVVITEPGGIRGNHFHKAGTEIATQRGPALVRFRDARGTQDVVVAPGEVYRFVIPPHCPHAFQNNGSQPNVLVAFNTVLFNPDQPDVQREVLI